MSDDIVERITAYLIGGGLFNPELANHDAVRDLLIDARAENEKLREALKPFALLSGRIPSDYENDRPDVTITLEKVPVKTIRAAANALRNFNDD